jgi:hypothetical protein
MSWDFTKVISLILIVLIIIIGYFGGWWDDFFHKPPPIQSSLKPATPSIDISEARLTGWDGQKKAWEIEARRIWQATDGNLVYFEEIGQGIIFSETEKRVDFKAGWARWEKLNGKLYIGAGLDAEMEEGKFSTREGMMDFRSQELVCQDHIHFSHKDITASADSMNVNFLKEELLLEGNIELIQNNNQVRAKGLWYDLKEEKYHLIEPKEVTLNP